MDFFFLLGFSLVVAIGGEVEVEEDVEAARALLLMDEIGGSSSSLSRISMISGTGFTGRVGPSRTINSGDTERRCIVAFRTPSPPFSFFFFFFVFLAGSVIFDDDESMLLPATGRAGLNGI